MIAAWPGESVGRNAAADRSISPDAHVANLLSAYIEFQAELVERAVTNVGFNFLRGERLNDPWDAEQLCHLARPDLHFLTADQGYARVANSAQRDRVHIVDVQVLRDPARAPEFLTQAVR